MLQSRLMLSAARRILQHPQNGIRRAIRRNILGPATLRAKQDVRRSPGTPPRGVGPPPDHDHGLAERRGHVHRAPIPAHHEVGFAQGGNEFPQAHGGERENPLPEIPPDRRRLPVVPGVEDVRLAPGRPEQEDARAVREENFPEGDEAVRGPSVLGSPAADVEGHQRSGPIARRFREGFARRVDARGVGDEPHRRGIAGDAEGSEETERTFHLVEIAIGLGQGVRVGSEPSLLRSGREPHPPHRPRHQHVPRKARRRGPAPDRPIVSSRADHAEKICVPRQGGNDASSPGVLCLLVDEDVVDVGAVEERIGVVGVDEDVDSGVGKGAANRPDRGRGADEVADVVPADEENFHGCAPIDPVEKPERILYPVCR